MADPKVSFIRRFHCSRMDPLDQENAFHIHRVQSDGKKVINACFSIQVPVFFMQASNESCGQDDINE